MCDKEAISAEVHTQSHMVNVIIGRYLEHFLGMSCKKQAFSDGKWDVRHITVQYRYAVKPFNKYRP